MMNKLFTSLACIGLLIATSCSAPKSELQVFKDMEISGSGAIAVEQTPLKIQPNDELVITVSSQEPTASAAYNLPLSNPATMGSFQISTQPKIQTYIVDPKGDITFPVLGKLHVEGMTTTQLAEDIARRVEVDVKDPVVRVELINFSVNVLGEVKEPGRIASPNQRFTILDALASAGDMTEYGRRDNVLLIREENGQATYHYLDLTKSDVVSSPYYYLRQNDVVMVSPTETKESNARYDTNNSYKMQVASTVVSCVSVIASLVIALLVK